MWTVLFIAYILLPSLLCREYVPSEGITNDEKVLLSRVIKRLEKSRHPEENSQANSGQDGHDLNASCGKLTISNEMIIRSNDSLQLGAKFLFEKKIDSNTACVAHCCKELKDSSCDTVVFNKNKNSCYLFSCGGVCLFSDNANYISTTIDKPASLLSSTTPVAIDNEEEIVDSDMDLDAYNHDMGKSHADEGNSDDSSLEENKTSNGLKPPGSTTLPSVLPSSALLGQSCDLNVQCQDPWAECSSQMCVCQEGYQQQDGICQKEEPQESSQSSEEEVKMGEDIPTPTENQHLAEEHTAPASEENPTEEGDHNNSNKESSSISAEETHKEDSASSEKDHHDVSNHDDESSSEEKGHKQGSASSEEENEDLLNKESGSDSEEETQEEDSSSSEKAEVDSTQQPSRNKGTATTTRTSATSHDKSVAVKKMNKFFGDVDLQVPIIALTVGLLFTMILLIFVTCRFCRVRRQLKKGRPLHCNEADYLINGMYL